jgi:arylformamidase
MKTVYLSYSLKNEVPVYGKTHASLEIKHQHRMLHGDSCDTYWFGMDNHWGTHIDAPAHFCMNGKKVSDYEADFWIFKKPQVVGINIQDHLMIHVQDLYGKISEDTDLLMLNTGYGVFRGTPKYSQFNPGIHSEVAYWLRETYPNLRVIGLDFVSLSSYQNREEGKKAHVAFLSSENVGHPILILEDMDLSSLSGELKEVIISPLRISQLDSAPCTVLGRYHD